MIEQEWRDRYARRIMTVTQCEEAYAIECANAVALGDGVYDIETDSPEDAADDEMEHWNDD